jgi:uncharacterized protein (TIGR03000 family)
MLRHPLRTGLFIVAIGLILSGANASARCGRGYGGCGGYGYGGGCGYGGYGYAGCGYGCYPGYGGGYGYGYGGWGYPAGGYGNGYMPGAYPSPTLTPPATAPRAPASYPPTSMNSAILDVTVPADAKVTVNDLPTTSTGQRRRYMSRDLQPGNVYRYQVRAEFMRDGKLTTDEQTVDLAAGATRSVTLGAAAGPKVADLGTAAQR